MRRNCVPDCAPIQPDGRCPAACIRLGMERTGDGRSLHQVWKRRRVRRGLYGEDGAVGDFLEQQGVGPYLDAVERYAELIPLMRADGSGQLVDFERTQPAEFRRVAIREALAESGYDYNRLIEALFDSDPLSGFIVDGTRSAERHIAAIADLIEAETDAAQIAAAAVLLAVSLGYSPAVVFDGVSFDMMEVTKTGV